MEQFADQTATPDVRAGNKGARAREQSNRLNRKRQIFYRPWDRVRRGHRRQASNCEITDVRWGRKARFREESGKEERSSVKAPCLFPSVPLLIVSVSGRFA